jgi:hypothetical protein
MARTTNDGREDSAGSIVSSKTGFAHTGTIVHNQRGNLVVTHFGLIKVKLVICSSETKAKKAN